MSNAACDKWREELAAKGCEFPTIEGAWDEATRQTRAEMAKEEQASATKKA